MQNLEDKKDSRCCGPAPMAITTARPAEKAYWMDGTVKTATGNVPRVSTRLVFKDKWSTTKVRWGIGRMKYAVNPGLYAVGSPTPESPVFVTANYKMSFDCLRSDLAGRDGWIMVLDTKAVNVWCSAGKGTFGTEELLHRLQVVRLKEIVSHNKLILPQLSATGVCAHEVKKQSGFKVIFGPVRSADIPAFLDANLQATSDMRQVKFPIQDRLALVPVEIVGSAKYALPLAIAMFLLSGLGIDGYSVGRLWTHGIMNAFLVGIAWIHGAVFTPVLLPWLPGRSFSVKGAWAGLLILIYPSIVYLLNPEILAGHIMAASWVVIIPVISSFLGMMFTGSSTYTSLSGVKREMRYAVPIQITAAVFGVGLWITGLFVKG